MEKRTFLKLSSALIAGGILSPLSSCEPEKRLRNWAGNLEYSAQQLHEPATLEELQALVKRLDHLRSLGTRHSFNTIADSPSHLVSLKHFNQVVEWDQEEQTVTVGAGMRYGELSQYLQSKSFALHNLASLPHISIAGACATGTHGSGVTNGNLSTAVRAIQFVTADGAVVGLSRDKDGDKFNGAVVALGAIGAITRVTVDIRPSFSVRQWVYQNLPLDELTKNFDAIMSAGYSVSLFTDWQNKNVSQVWIKSKSDSEQPPPNAEFFGAKPATRNLHPIEALSAENCTEQMGVAGPWHERLPHFKLGFTPSSGEELQAEYFVGHQNAVDAILAVEKLKDQITPNLLISEIRTIDADNLWMSPCYKRPSVAIHFTLKPDWNGVQKLLPQIEKELAPFDARPHWAKLFTMAPDHLQSLYERLPDFRQLLNEYDPKEKFRNAFVKTNIF